MSTSSMQQTAGGAVPALELKDLRKSFGHTEIIRGANLRVAAGERVAIIGPNGAGKSTLFNLISGRFHASTGDILVNGKSILGRKPFEINRMGLARSFQVSNLFTRLSVFENLRCAVLWSRLPTASLCRSRPRGENTVWRSSDTRVRASC